MKQVYGKKFQLKGISNMSLKKSTGESVFDIANNVLMLFMIIITLYPLLYILFASLSDPLRVMQGQKIIFGPNGFSTAAYKAVFQNPSILSGFKNTIMYVCVGTSINMILTILGAYALSKKGLYGRKLFMFIIVFTMFFSGGLVPTYLLVKSLAFTNTIWAIVLPNAISTFNLIIVRTSFHSISDSISESARMDGANDFIILFLLYVPISIPVIAVIILYYAVGHWNSWFGASIYLKSRELYPIQLILREILVLNNTDNMMIGAAAPDVQQIGQTIKYSTIIVSTVPILVIYPFLQKYFVKGIMVGSLKE